MQSQAINALLKLMADLRDSQTGCPWDRAQTHQSIAHYAVEEAYELKDAIDRDDATDMQSELGDMLLQVVFHAQIAHEKGNFQFDDVVRNITEKMIARHPHVFGTSPSRTAEQQHNAWEAQKAKEREAQKHHSHMDNIPVTLPAMSRTEKMLGRAARIGFAWTDTQPIFDKIQEELAEVQEAIAAKNIPAISEEIGDALFALITLAAHLSISAEDALHQTNKKFDTRFRHMEHAARKAGGELDGEPLTTMLARWTDAKSAT